MKGRPSLSFTFLVASLASLKENRVGRSNLVRQEDRVRVVNAEWGATRLPSHEMKSYDIVFVGHMATGQIVPFEGEPLPGRGGGSFFGALAASCLDKRLAVVTRMARADLYCLEPLSVAGIDVYVQPSAETTQLHLIYPSASVDERRVFIMKNAGFFRLEEMPPLQPCLIHLGGLNDQEFTIEFVRTLKRRGFQLSVDMQSFVLRVDKKTGAIRFHDVAEKREILSMARFIKLDAAEAKILTGTDQIETAAAILNDWGSNETVITRADGALVRSGGKNYFQRFTNRGIQGRTGRGDTFMGSYLARRMDYPVQESLRFAAALTSIKIETNGPFDGTLLDVLEREKNGSP